VTPIRIDGVWRRSIDVSKKAQTFRAGEIATPNFPSYARSGGCGHSHRLSRAPTAVYRCLGVLTHVRGLSLSALVDPIFQ
jgi:hypothetical protein